MFVFHRRRGGPRALVNSSLTELYRWAQNRRVAQPQGQRPTDNLRESYRRRPLQASDTIVNAYCVKRIVSYFPAPSSFPSILLLPLHQDCFFAFLLQPVLKALRKQQSCKRSLCDTLYNRAKNLRGALTKC